MTTDQLDELKAIQDAYLEMANKRQEEVEEVFESERSEKYKSIVSSLDRMRAKATANAELQKLKKQNKDHKKLPEEVEEEIEEGVLKSISRGLQGWSKGEKAITGAANSPRDIVIRNKGYDNETTKMLHKTSGGPDHSPAGLQKRVLDREMKKRGLTKEEVELEEGKIPVNHAHDVVGSVLGQSAAVKFASNLKAGTTKHTTWKDINSALVKQGEQTHHIAKIAAKLKPAQYNEEIEELDEVSMSTLDSYRKKAFDEPGFKRQAGRKLAYDKSSSHGDSKVKSSEEIDVAKSQIKDLIKPEHHSKYPISKITSMTHGRKIYRDASAAGHLKEEVESLDEISDKLATNYTAKSQKAYNDPKTTPEKKANRRKGLITAYLKSKAEANVPTTYESVELEEKELTDTDVKQKEKVVKGMKKNLQSFKDKYGERAKGVMHATATKIAQKMPDVKEEVELEEADTYGWRTNKTPEGHKWEVHSFTYGEKEKVLHSGIESTRTKAVTKAKKHVMPYRRGEKVEEASVFDQVRKTVADDEKKGVDPKAKFNLMMTKAKNSQRAAKALAKESLDEARTKKEPMEVYHTGYSAALQHAEKHLNKQGYEIHPDDWQEHISHGPSKPSEGKTVQLHVPLHKDGVKTKKVAHIQVYNRGNTIPKNNELNMYVN